LTAAAGQPVPRFAFVAAAVIPYQGEFIKGEFHHV
jgi:hypothetical protein